MKKDLPIIQIASALIMIFLLIGCVEAGSNGVSVIKMNGGAYDHSKYTVGTDTATVSKEIGFTVTGNGGKFAYTASGPVSATSGDGNVTVSVDAMKLAISGKTSGSGVATANATILATGTANAAGVNVFTIVESETSVDTGSKLGSAEASAYASGEAESEAAYNGVELEAEAEGTTSAYGLVTSPKAFADSEGEILGVARYATVDGQTVTDPFSEVESWVEGSGTATASATANGHSEAILVDPVTAGIWIINASGNTAASGTSKYTGYFDVEAESEARADYDEEGNTTWADIWTHAYTEGNDKYAQATGKATVKSGLSGAAALSAPSVLVAGAAGNASAASSIRSIGWAHSDSEIYAESVENGNFMWWDDFEELGYNLDVNGRLVDDTWLWSYSETSGETVGFTGSAAGSADGGGLAAGYFIEQTGTDPITFDIGNSAAIAGGAVKSSATSKNLGWAEADSSIASVDAIDAGVFLHLYAGDDGLIDAKVPVDLDEVGLQQELELNLLYYAPVFEASVIQQNVAAEGKGSSDTAEAKATAAGLTSAVGTFVDQDDGPLSWIADTRAAGEVAGIAQANMCTDPTSTSIIAEFDSAIWEDAELDIALVGSASYAHGKCGYTAAEAAGVAGTPSAQAADLDVGAYAAGEAATMAQANNANSLALAGIASGSYAGEEDMTILGANGTLIDASLVGSAALTFGASGTAAAEAAGTTSAYGNVLTADEAVSGSMGTIVDGAATESDAYVKNGIALDAAAVTSFGVVQLGQSGDVLQDNYATGVSAIVDVSFAEAAKKTDIAKAAGEAEGSTRTSANFFVNDIVNGVTQAGTIKTSAEGTVEDAVEAVSADPLAASVVTSFAVVNGEPVFVPSLVVDGSLVGSLAMADGDAAKAAGEAAGVVVSGAELMITNLDEEQEPVQTHLFAQTDAMGEAETYANANGGLALSIAGDGAVSVVLGTPDPNELATVGSSVQTERIPKEPLHAILLGDLVELTPEQHDEMVENLCAELGQAAKYEYVPENVGDTACDLWELLAMNAAPSATATADPLIVDGSLSGAASFVVGKGGAGSEVAGTSGSSGWFTVAEEGVTETSLNSLTDSIADVETDVSSMNGIALAAGGAGSLDVVVYEYGNEELTTPPTGDLIEASLLGDIAFADGFGTKDTAWAKVSVDGLTTGSGAFVDELNNASASTEAVGQTTGYTKATYMDPLSISLIGAISNVEAEATTIDPPPPAAGTEFEVEDTTFIVTLSTAAGKGTGIATGTAIGEAEVEHAQNLNWYATGGGRTQMTEAESEGSFKSGVEVTNGIAVAAAGASTDGEVDFELPGFDRSAESEAMMFAYTGGDGAVIKSNAAATGVEAEVFNADHRNNVVQTLLLDSDAYVAGNASSSIYALNSGAESLAMAVSEAEAIHEGEPASAYAQSFFGVQMLGDNGASQTVKADMSNIDVYSNAYARNGTAADARVAMVDLWDAGASAILQPKVNTAAANAWNDYENYDFSLGGGVQIGGFADVNTLVDPNFAYAFRYGRAQGQGGIPPTAVPADFIVLW